MSFFSNNKIQPSQLKISNPFAPLEDKTLVTNKKKQNYTKIFLGTSWNLHDMEQEVLRATAPHRHTRAQRDMRKQISQQIHVGPINKIDPTPSVVESTSTRALWCADITRCAVQAATYSEPDSADRNRKRNEQFREWVGVFERYNSRSEEGDPGAYLRRAFPKCTRSNTKSLLGKYVKMQESSDTLCDTVESFLIFWYMIINARSAADRYVAIANHAKLLHSRMSNLALSWTVLTQAYEYFCPEDDMEVQSDTLPIFDDLQSFLDKFEMIKQSPLFAKLYKFSMFSMALSLFKPLGIDMDFMKFEKVTQEAMRKKYHMGPDFIHCVLDTMLFLAKRGYQSYQAGSIMPMFHSEAKYQDWYDRAEKLARQAQFLSNPEVHGIDRFSYLSDLKDVIERGHSMRKCTTQKDEKALITKMLSTLELTHDLELTKRAAQADRKSPLTLLLYGGSGIGKSTLQNVFFQHYGKRRALNTSPEYRYVRNPTDPFWSGMNSTQWCIILDDIGFLAPQLGVLDPTLAELLCIANNVPYVPNQAELADKGRTPVRAELAIGSTNTEHLNTKAYFSCPLAVQRRFPWVLDVKVKPEYQNVDRPGMLDSSKVPVLAPGEYPDLWIFVVKRVEPCGEERLGQQGKLVEVLTTNSMRELLVWYNEVIDNHNKVQEQILVGNTTMQETQLCAECNMPTNWCRCLTTQSDQYVTQPEVTSTELVAYTSPSYLESFHVDEYQPPLHPALQYINSLDIVTQVVIGWYAFLYWMLCDRWYTPIVELYAGEGWFARKIWSSRHRARLMRATIGYAGSRVESRFGNGATLAKIAAAITACLVVYKTSGFIGSMFTRRPDAQGGVASKTYDFERTGRVPQPDGETVEKPSYADPYPYSNADLSQATLCSRSQDGTLIARHIEAATCLFHSTQEGVVRVTTAVNVRGSVYMVNNHGIPAGGDFYLDIRCEEKGTLSGTMRNLLIKDSMLHRLPEHDLAFVYLRCRPCATDLTKYFCKKNFVGRLEGTYFGRDVTGRAWKLPMHNIKPVTAKWLTHGGEVTREMWEGRVEEPTALGDCGSLLLSQTPAGWAILGVHTLGRNDVAMAMKVTLETVVAACDILEPHYFARGKPTISAPSAPRELGDLARQSVVNKALPGVANVIGSFVGEAWIRGRTNVTETYIAPFLSERGYEVTRVAPDMSKKPWEHALRDTTRPVVLMDNTVLDQATVMYREETMLPDVSQVHVYPLSVAINGCPGLQYCDKMNRTSSAGAPYKRSKRHYMFYVDETTSTDMDVTDEIKDAVQEIIITYQRGERTHAIFCGHLKDEPVTFEKRESAKTRVFTASGIAYTLVVRMYLLSTIVYMQKNRFVYETGPGTVVQSLEWEAIREYLVQHGEDRIVAGDYSKFDKRMPANVILAAFDIIVDLCTRAGYTKEDLMVVRGIAYDTAFPTVDFNGDLIEFYGSNPSGHPLTVIINGIANSLYMRYCYLILRPIGCTVKFKEYVSLMTYGDDNIMGVSPDAPWFEHTAIQKVLGDIDIGYTMADKEAVSVPYINIADANFLKRTWRWDEDVDAYVAPLDRSSIEKMLTVCVAKKNVTPKCHALQVIGTAVREYFWYGKEEFETATEMFKEIISKADLELYVEDSTFPTWESLYEDFWARSEQVKLGRPTRMDKVSA